LTDQEDEIMPIKGALGAIYLLKIHSLLQKKEKEEKFG
jgi:hypothetical protein